jgi:hypothetical protein
MSLWQPGQPCSDVIVPGNRVKNAITHMNKVHVSEDIH